jgi:hypothetical protein
LQVVCERAIGLGGLASISAFVIAFDSLRNEGILKQIRQPRPSEAPEFSLTADQYNALSAYEITTHYQRDPEWREAIDRLISTGAI